MTGTVVHNDLYGIQPLPPSYSTSLLLLLFTNILQSHGLVMTRALALPLSLAVARIQGVSCFDNSVLTQVRTAVFQHKKKKGPLWKGIFGEVAPRPGTGFYIQSLWCSSG